MNTFSKKITCIVSSLLLCTTCIPDFSSTMYANAAHEQIEKALSWAVSIANDDSHGYSQSRRNGPDYDCSSLVVHALNHAGISTGSASYTGNLKSELTKNGFTWIPWSQINNVSNLQRGDILLYRGSSSGHTEFYLGNSQNVAAHGTYNHPETGDQTGKEISVAAYWYDNWNGVLRYNYSGPDPDPIQSQEGCFSPCGTSFTSIVEALKSIGVDSSMTYRKQIAVANGISGYSGTANQNTQMLSMLKAGTLKIPNGENPVVPEEPPVIDYGTGVFPTCSSSFSSIVDALKSIGVDSSMSNRKTIAAANGISNYSGTADQNNQMLNLLKSGQLKNPNAVATTPDTSGKYFSACSSGATSIVDALKSIGVDSSMSNRKTIAAANGISGYSGTADQNNQMLNLLKSGQLMNPSYVAPPEIVNYNVTLNANGGYTPIDNLPVASDSTYAGLPVASREGYTFNGWFTSADGGSQVSDGNGLVSASDHTLYAHWSANQYTVSFENNDGSGITSSKDVVYDNNYGELPVPTRTGYTFTGWFTDIADGVQVTSDTKYNYADNQTVYAHWQANQYQVTLNYYETNDTYKYFPACPANITNFVDGLKTVGADSSFANRKAIAALNDIADYAGTTSQNDQMLSLLKKGELRSDYSNIVGLPAPFDTITVTYYNFYGEMPIPEYGSKIFKGWFTEDGTEITKESTVLTAKDHALYAHWDDAFELSSDSVVLKSGEQYEIKSNQKNLTYKSNNTDVAVVSKNGVITALDEGTATISVINADSDVLQVNVKVISESIKGDANNDGEINIADAVMLQKWLLGSGNLIDWHNANLCEDEKIDVFDMIEMRKLLIKNK